MLKYNRMKSLLFAIAALFLALGLHAGELQKAAAAGDLEKVRSLIKANPAAISARDAGTTALHEATRAGHIEIVKLLLASGANVNATDFSGLTPLRLAVGTRRLEIASYLRQHGGVERVASTQPATRTAAPPAAQKNANLFGTNRATAKAPAQAASNAGGSNAAMRIPGRQATTREMLPVIFPIHEAARIGDVEQIKFLFQNAPEILNSTDQKGLTALHVAAANHQLRVAETLLALRADVNARANNGQTPLHAAVRNGDSAIAGLLITNRAVVDARDKAANTPLLLALQAADAEALDVAGGLSTKTSVVASNSVAAMKVQQFRLASLLVGARADVNARSASGASPLSEAVRLGNEPVVDLLLRRGANPAVTEPDTGRTPLHVAAMLGDTSMIKALLQAKANVDTVDRRGETPLCYALREGRTDAISALRHAGATIGKARPLGKTEQSLVAFYRETEAALQRGSSVEKGKILIGLNPTKADCERMFPKHGAAAWKVVEEINRQIKAAFAHPLPDAEQGKEIWRILPEPPSLMVQDWRSRGLLSTELPVFSLAVDKIGAGTRPGDYCLVNGHWVMVPPLRHIAAQVAVAEPPRR